MSESNPLVSVIINCYNGEKYLAEAINSIYSQTYKNWEIIFWDNASSDKSALIAKSYDAKLKYYNSNFTSSLSHARFQAFKKTSGKYISFLDCDDLWKNDKIEKQIKIISKDENIGFVYGLSEIIYDEFKNNFVSKKKNIIPANDKLFEGMIFDKLIIEDFIPFPSVMIDKKKLLELGDFPSNYNHSIDYWIFLNLSKKYNIKLLNEVCCKYRIHKDNLSNIQHVICALENIKIVKSFISENTEKSVLLSHYTNLTIAYLKEKKFFKALVNIYNNGGLNLIIIRLIKKVINRAKGYE